MAVSRRTNCSPVNGILPLMRKAFNPRPVQTRSSVSRSAGTYMKMLAPFGLKYYRPQCVFLPRNLCIMRGEIDYVASNRFVDPRGIRSTPPMECLISGTGWMAPNWTRPDAHSRGRLPVWDPKRTCRLLEIEIFACR